jgi:putative ABC transport system permease protein
MGTLQQVRYALRGFGRNPGFAAVVVLTLAVGIGANTAIFSVANALLLRPLPYAHPERLVSVGRPGLQPISWPRFHMIAENQQSFTGLAAFTNESFNLTGRGDPAQLKAARVSWDFFDVLGVQPATGRWFHPDEDQPGGANVVVLSNKLWQSRFAGNPDVAGQHITLDSTDYTVIGVAPADFQFPLLESGVELYAPRVIELNLITPVQAMGGTMFLDMVGRLRPGSNINQVQAEIDTLSARYRQANLKLPDADPKVAIQVADLRDVVVAGVRTAVLVLFGAVGLVLLIACANVSSLLLSRALGRQREIAVRMAIGASRGVVVRQLLTESLVLALAGGILGAILSVWGARALAALAQEHLPRAGEVAPDWHVLAFAAAVSVLAGVLFGLAPAWQVSRPDLNVALRSEGRGATAGRRRNVYRNLLVVGQVTLSTVLLIGAGLLVRNFLQLRGAAPGFDATHLLTMHIMLPPARYPKAPQMIAFYDELMRQVRAVPGVTAAVVSSALPLNPARLSPALPEGQPAVPVMQRPIFNIQTFVPGYVETMRLPLKAGREFTGHDDAQAPKVAMVNETLARRYWPRENPIGKHIWLGRQPLPCEVVGVLGDVRNTSLAADVNGEIYVPFAQLPWGSMHLVARTEGDPQEFAGVLRAAVLAVDKDQPVTEVRTMENVLAAGAEEPRFTTTLLGGLAAMALILALVGIYGVIAYSVAERTQEMGIRVALGAARGDILRLVLRQGMGLAIAGIAVGLAGSLVLTRLLATMLYRVSATDPLTFAAAAALFVCVAALASYVPARKATRVDPMIALRGE